MRESETQMLITVFGGQHILAQALGVRAYAPEVQDKILGHFCEVVFKRVLLDASAEHINTVIDAFERHRASGRSLDMLIEDLRRVIPDMDEYVRKEMTRSVCEFRIEVPAQK